MGTAAKVVLAFAAGAGVATLFDKQPGRRRRAVLKDKAIHATHGVVEGADVIARDLMNRGHGLLAELRAELHDQMEDDHVIEERVRSRLGRVCSRPHAIVVKSVGGHVLVEGEAIADEHDRILAAIELVRGVRSVENGMTVHAYDSKRDGTRRVRRKPEGWTPALRFVASAAGGSLAFYGLGARNPFRVGAGIAGALLASRAIANVPLTRLFGLRAGSDGRGIDVRKTVEIEAPIEEVFAYFTALENFPRFMTHVREVKKLDDRRYRFRVEGPARIPFEWEGIITQLEPNRTFAWSSTEGASVRNSGVVRFETVSPWRTRVHVRLKYSPPAGAIGHAVAKLLGADPKKEMDDDLLRLASLVAAGKATGRHGLVRAEDAAPPQR